MKRIVRPRQTTKDELDAHWQRQFNITSFLFDQQLAFVEDPAPFKIAVCSRRAGKTTACAAHLIHTAINNPDSTSVYITMTGTSGKRIIWKEFKNIVNKFKLPIKINDLEMSLTAPNNSVIYVIGAKDEMEIEKIRGIGIKLCYIDECQSFKKYIEYLIDDIIGPALMDNMGSLCLIGTPGAVEAGYFHKCWTQSEGWSKHSWTFWNNFKWPAVIQGHNHDEIFQRELKRSGRTDQDASVRREFFGEWKTDTNSLWIRYDRNLCNFNDLPVASDYSYVLGIDVGYEDADALAVLAWNNNSPDTYLVEELITNKQGLTELVNQVQALRKKYDFHKIVMDMGGLGKKLGEEMSRRYLIPVEAADKTNKQANAELMNDCLRTGRFKARHDSQFVQDAMKVEIDWDKSTPERIVVSDRFHSDIIDAVLYAFKLSPAYAWEPEAKKPTYGSKAWAEAEVRGMFERELEVAQKQSEYSKWLKGGYGD